MTFSATVGNSKATEKIVMLREWSTTGPDQEPRFRAPHLTPDLLKRIAAINADKRLEITPLHDGLRVTTGSWVGWVELGDLTLSIQPKIAPEYIPTFIRYALGLSIPRSSQRTVSPLSHSNFLDLLAFALLDEVDALLSAGVFQDYRETRTSLTMPRGAPLFGEMARHPATTRLALPCRFAQRTPALPLNRLIVAALFSLIPSVQDRTLSFDLHARATLLRELCGDVPLSHTLLDEAKATLDRRTSYYEPAVRLIELLLGGLSSAFDTQERETLRTFLFDMSALFERFVARLCRDYAPQDLTIETQEPLRRAYQYSSNPYQWPVPRLRPDLVVRRKSRSGFSDEPLLILDTKYKLLDKKRPSSADLYQLTLYSLAFGHDKPVPARIVFPTQTSASTGIPLPCLQFVGFAAAQTPASIDLFGLSLPTVAGALQRRERSTLREIVALLLRAPS